MSNEIDWEPFEDGETISTSKIANTNDSIRARINAIQVDDIAEESLNREHLTTGPIVSAFTISNNSIPDMTEISGNAHRFPGWPTWSMPPSDAFDPVPMGTPGTPFHWRTDITHSEAECAVNFKVRGKQIFVMANIHVTQLYVEYPSFTGMVFLDDEKTDSDDVVGAWGVTKPISKKVKGSTPHVYGFFMICLVDADRKLYPVPKTLRYIDSDTNTNTGRDMAEEDREKFEVARGDVEGDTGVFFKPERDQVNALPRVSKDVAIRSMIRYEDILPADASDPHTLPDEFVAVRFVASVLGNRLEMTAKDEVKMHIAASRISAFVPDMYHHRGLEPDKDQISPDRAAGSPVVTLGGGVVTPSTDPASAGISGGDDPDIVIAIGTEGVDYIPS